MKARTIEPDYEILGLSKYTNYIVGFRNSMNLYGLSHNSSDIKKKKQMLIFEGEKSVLKLDTITGGHSFGVALAGSSLSDWQANLIYKIAKKIKDLEIIIGLDKDVDGLYVLQMCKQLKDVGCENLSYIDDKNDLLSQKDSPIDKGIKVFWELFESRKQY